jgi:zinc and cadmium transporter
MSITEILLLFIFSLAGAIGGWKIKIHNPIFLKLMIAYTGGFLLAVCLLHLLPEVYQSGIEQIPAFVLGGFILQILLDQMSAGVEHGHIHIHMHESSWKPFIILSGLYLHSLMEGLPLAGHSHSDLHGSHDLYLAVALHKLPEGFALGILLRELNKNPLQSWIAILLFASMTPAGSLISLVLSPDTLEEVLPVLLALVIGLFLHLSTTILFEAGSTDHQISFRRILAILLGIFTAYLVI